MSGMSIEGGHNGLSAAEKMEICAIGVRCYTNQSA
jgi:hypothetical protein